jgi:hypothetical protein
MIGSVDPTHHEKGEIVTLTISSGLLAASMLLGQAGTPTTAAPTDGGKIVQAQDVPAPPTISQTQTQSQQPSRPILGWFTREDRPIFSKITGWFKRDPSDGQPQQAPIQPTRGNVIRETPPPPMIVTPPPAAPANDFPRRMPNPTSQATTPRETIVKEAPAPTSSIQQTSLQQAAVPKAAKSPILPKLVDKIGRDDKFEWITGQLEIENGAFVLYYATPETIDPHHGRIVLTPQEVNMKQFQRGDLISVRGQLAQRQTAQGMTATYRLTMASLIERPKS